MKRNIISGLALGLIFTAIGFSCSKSSDDNTSTSSRKLYIATGLCYSGATFVAPTINDVGQILSRLDLSSLNYEVIHDYNDQSDEEIGTYANGMQDGGDGYIYVAVENSGFAGSQRRVDKILKTPFGTKTVWSPSGNLVGTVVRGLSRASDSGFIVGTTSGIERFDSSPARITRFGGGSWGGAHAAAPADCSGNNLNITNIISLPASVTGDAYGKYIYSHAGPGQNDIGIVSKEGSIANSCLANAAGGSALASGYATTAIDYGVPGQSLDATATPTSMVYIAGATAGTGKLLVAYSSYGDNTAGGGMFNGLVMYDITENTVAGETATINAGKILYNNQVYFFGVTSIAYDSSTGNLYAASSPLANGNTPTGYTIEKFSIDLSAGTATRLTAADGTSSFQSPNSFNNCVTSMFVAD